MYRISYRVQRGDTLEVEGNAGVIPSDFYSQVERVVDACITFNLRRIEWKFTHKASLQLFCTELLNRPFWEGTIDVYSPFASSESGPSIRLPSTRQVAHLREAQLVLHDTDDTRAYSAKLHGTPSSPPFEVTSSLFNQRVVALRDWRHRAQGTYRYEALCAQLSRTGSLVIRGGDAWMTQVVLCAFFDDPTRTGLFLVSNDTDEVTREMIRSALFRGQVGALHYTGREARWFLPVARGIRAIQLSGEPATLTTMTTAHGISSLEHLCVDLGSAIASSTQSHDELLHSFDVGYTHNPHREEAYEYEYVLAFTPVLSKRLRTVTYHMKDPRVHGIQALTKCFEELTKDVTHERIPHTHHVTIKDARAIHPVTAIFRRLVLECRERRETRSQTFNRVLQMLSRIYRRLLGISLVEQEDSAAERYEEGIDDDATTVGGEEDEEEEGEKEMDEFYARVVPGEISSSSFGMDAYYFSVYSALVNQLLVPMNPSHSREENRDFFLDRATLVMEAAAEPPLVRNWLGAVISHGEYTKEEESHEIQYMKMEQECYLRYREYERARLEKRMEHSRQGGVLLTEEEARHEFLMATKERLNEDHWYHVIPEFAGTDYDGYGL